jgi:hypothetical protein
MFVEMSKHRFIREQQAQIIASFMMAVLCNGQIPADLIHQYICTSPNRNPFIREYVAALYAWVVDDTARRLGVLFIT